MSLSVTLSRGVLLLLSGLALSGCPPSVQSQLDEEKEPHFLAGMSRINTMDYQGAIQSFEKALTVNPKSASAHFELGWLFDQKESDPAAAIYHYEHYLKLRPEAEKAEFVKQHIFACKQELARTVSLAPITEKQQRDLEKLVEDNKRLVERNKQLTEELGKWRVYYAAQSQSANPPVRSNPPVAAASTAATGQSDLASRKGMTGPTNVVSQPDTVTRNLAAASSGTGAPPVQAVPGAGSTARPAASLGYSSSNSASVGPSKAAAARTHTVKPRETLGTIARQYGVKLEALETANPGVNPRRIRPGQVLKLP